MSNVRSQRLNEVLATYGVDVSMAQEKVGRNALVSEWPCAPFVYRVYTDVFTLTTTLCYLSL